MPSLTAGLVKLPEAFLTSLDLAILSGPLTVLSRQILLGIHLRNQRRLRLNLICKMCSLFVVICGAKERYVSSVSQICRFTCVCVQLFSIRVLLKMAPGTLKGLPIKGWLELSGLPCSCCFSYG